jgi:hypothetical protein
LASNPALRATRPAGRPLSAHTLGGATLYFFDAASLRKEVADHSLTERDYLHYFVGLVLVWGAPLFSVTFPESWFQLVVLVPTYGVAIAGVWHCYRSNGGDSGSNFVIRLVPFAFLMALRIAVIGIAGLVIVMALFMALASRLEFVEKFSVHYLFVLGGFALQAYYWWLVGRELKCFSSARAT